MQRDSVFIVMGVSGCGKSTIGQDLARATGGIFLDGDDFHSPANKAKMAAALPLTDEDRWPWLDRLNQELRATAGQGQPVFLACSALRQAYRDRLVAGLPQVRFVYLKGPFALMHDRLSQRQNHFMPAALLESQFATLEEPKDALVLDLARSPAQLREDFLRLTR
jgi:gluconokinase